MFNDHLNYLKQAVLCETVKSCLLTEPYLKSAVPNLGYAYPWGTPEFFQGTHGGLFEAKVPCSCAKMLSVCVVHERENVFL